MFCVWYLFGVNCCCLFSLIGWCLFVNLLFILHLVLFTCGLSVFICWIGCFIGFSFGFSFGFLAVSLTVVGFHCWVGCYLVFGILLLDWGFLCWVGVSFTGLAGLGVWGLDLGFYMGSTGV